MIYLGNVGYYVFAQANLMLGPSVWVRLLMLVPRAHHGRTVGCEFKTSEDELSVHSLSALMESLQPTPIATFMGSDASRRAGARKRAAAR